MEHIFGMQICHWHLLLKMTGRKKMVSCTFIDSAEAAIVIHERTTMSFKIQEEVTSDYYYYYLITKHPGKRHKHSYLSRITMEDFPTDN